MTNKVESFSQSSSASWSKAIRHSDHHDDQAKTSQLRVLHNTLRSPLLSGRHPKRTRRQSSFSSTRLRSTPFPYFDPLPAPILSKTSFFLSRIVFLRALAFVYGIAFLIAKDQNRALIGDQGITPAKDVLIGADARGVETRKRRYDWLSQSSSSDSNKPLLIEDDFSTLKKARRRLLNRLPIVRKTWSRIIRTPFYQQWRERLWDRQDGMGRPVTTLLWLAKDRNALNPWLQGISRCGIGLSLLVFVMGSANVPILLALWMCQRSLMAVGGPWYGYGWEPQLAELGFHAMFLVPFWNVKRLPILSPPSILVIYAIRWYLFRIMMGAGLIKLKSGDPKWKWPTLSAMDYFYETQPVPNPLTKFFHCKPKRWHQMEVLMNHFVELVAPWLLLLPFSQGRRMGGIIQLAFQVILVSSGNLSFLNWLTMVPAILCLDDAMWAPFFTTSWQRKAALCAKQQQVYSIGAMRKSVSMLFLGWIAWASIPVVKNLLAKRQAMNRSFGPLRLVNTYGAFGTVTEERMEFIVSAASSYDGPWKEYQFKVKPGDVRRRPRFLSPYHYRLDWQMWISALSPNIEQSPWIYRFLEKLLQRDEHVLALLQADPFENDEKGPKYIQVEKYKYRFNTAKQKVGDDDDGEAAFWERERMGRVFPKQGIASLETFRGLGP